MELVILQEYTDSGSEQMEEWQRTPGRDEIEKGMRAEAERGENSCEEGVEGAQEEPAKGAEEEVTENPVDDAAVCDQEAVSATDGAVTSNQDDTTVGTAKSGSKEAVGDPDPPSVHDSESQVPSGEPANISAVESAQCKIVEKDKAEANGKEGYEMDFESKEVSRPSRIQTRNHDKEGLFLRMEPPNPAPTRFDLSSASTSDETSENTESANWQDELPDLCVSVPNAENVVFQGLLRLEAEGGTLVISALVECLTKREEVSGLVDHCLDVDLDKVSCLGCQSDMYERTSIYCCPC